MTTHRGESMTIRTVIFRFSTFCALVLFLAMSSMILFAQSPDSEEISNLLQDAKSHAALSANDAADMDAFTRSNVSWSTYTSKLSPIREHVNELGKIHAQLADMRHLGSPWQQNAIDQIEPLLQEMADTLTATIKHLNDNQSRVHMPQFEDYVHATHELASNLSDMIRDYVAYDAAKAKAEDLERKLELGGSDSPGY